MNRSLNKLAISSSEIPEKMLSTPYKPLSQEPAYIQIKLHSVKIGCIELQVIADALNGIGLDHDTAKNLLLDIIGNAIYNPENIKTLAKDISRAVKRVAESSKNKLFTISITIKGKTKRIMAKVSPDAKKVEVHRNPPDDIQ